jgi:hypothetical protein
LAHWDSNPRIEILGNHRARRLSIISFRIRHGEGSYLHHNHVVALLNDLFGVQARGGCSCAGPYGHRLLAIDAATSHALLDEVVHGCDGIKARWTRVNFNYFISDTVRDYLIDAVDLIATHGHRLLPGYRFDAHTGQWRHRDGPDDPPLRLTDVRFTADGRLTAPEAHHRRLGEERWPANSLAPARCWPPVPTTWATVPAVCQRTSSVCAGSRCRRSAWNKPGPAPVEPSGFRYPAGYKRGERNPCRPWS